MSNSFSANTIRNYQAKMEVDKRRRAPYWITAGFIVFALTIAMATFGGARWLMACVPVCALGVTMIAIGTWGLLPAKRWRITTLIVTSITLSALAIAFITT